MTKFKIEQISDDLYELSLDIPPVREVFGSEIYYKSFETDKAKINQSQYDTLQEYLSVSDDLFQIECHNILNLRVFKVGQAYNELYIDAFAHLDGSIKTIYGTGQIGATFLLLECNDDKPISFVLNEVKGSNCYFNCVITK
jgi:hypothetical protein